MFNLCGKTRKMLSTVGVTLQKKCVQQAGSGDTTLLITAHTAGLTSQCTVRHFSLTSAVASSAFVFFFRWMGGIQCKKKKKNTNNLEEQEKYFRSRQPEKPCAKQSQQHSHHNKITSYRRTTVGANSGARTLVQRNEQRSGVPKKKEAERFEFGKFPNSVTLVMWKKNFQSEVCSSSCFPKEQTVWVTDADSARNMDE